MEFIFRNKLFSDEKFKFNFNNLVKDEKIIEIPNELWDIIKKDNRKIFSEENKSLSTYNILKEGYNEGKCYELTTNLALLFLLHGFDVYQVVGKNEFFKGTKGSPSGAHYYLEIFYNNTWYILDTSLLCMIKKYNTHILGYEETKKIKAEDMLLDKNYLKIYEELKKQ